MTMNDLCRKLAAALNEEFKYLCELEANILLTPTFTELDLNHNELIEERKKLIAELHTVVDTIRTLWQEIQQKQEELPAELKPLVAKIRSKAMQIHKEYAELIANIERSKEGVQRNSRKLFYQNKNVLSYLENQHA